MPNYTPTPEQQAIVDASLTGQNVIVKARAGTGKTSTLELIANANSSKNIAYIAFNRPIADEAASKFPANVDARTAHSHAYRAIVMGDKTGSYRRRISEKSIPSSQLATAIGIKSSKTFKADDGDDIIFKASTLAFIVKLTVKRFCQTGDLTISEKHVPRRDGLHTNHKHLAAYIAPIAAQVWDRTTPLNGDMDFGFETYLKMWQLSNPIIMAKGKKADIILWDEAQDANPCMAAIIDNQKAQVICVGDNAQAIYGFTGAIDFLNIFDAPHSLYLTKSFRFGTAIAEVANVFLTALGEDANLVGHDPVPSTVNFYQEVAA